MRQIHSVSLTERCLSINADSSSSDGSSAGSSAATGGDRDSFLGTSESAGAGLFASRGKVGVDIHTGTGLRTGHLSLTFPR